MENYEKGDTVEEELDHREPFAHTFQLPLDVLTVKVRGGSKIQALIDVALRGMNVSYLPNVFLFRSSTVVVMEIYVDFIRLIGWFCKRRSISIDWSIYWLTDLSIDWSID